jgi:hypothetical protein
MLPAMKLVVQSVPYNAVINPVAGFGRPSSARFDTLQILMTFIRTFQPFKPLTALIQIACMHQLFHVHFERIVAGLAKCSSSQAQNIANLAPKVEPS